MNQHLKNYLQRGIVFGGFGPIVMGVIYFILSCTIEGFALTGKEMFVAIISVYLLAFVQAGASVLNQIENWPIAKSLFCHLGVLYIAYTLCYLVNSWITFDAKVLLIFTIIFALIYMVVWGCVFTIVKLTQKKLNSKI